MPYGLIDISSHTIYVRTPSPLSSVGLYLEGEIQILNVYFQQSYQAGLSNTTELMLPLAGGSGEGNFLEDMSQFFTYEADIDLVTKYGLSDQELYYLLNGYYADIFDSIADEDLKVGMLFLTIVSTNRRRGHVNLAGFEKLSTQRAIVNPDFVFPTSGELIIPSSLGGEDSITHVSFDQYYNSEFEPSSEPVEATEEGYTNLFPRYI